MQTFLSYKDKNNEEKFTEVRDVFAEVMMSVLGTKDLYEAWENSYQATIDDYRTTEVIFHLMASSRVN